MKFFFDNCVSSRIAAAVRALADLQHLEIVHLREKFPEEIDDIEWIPKLAAEGEWVIVSGDERISRSRAEKAAWRESGMTAFFFASGFANKSRWVQAEIVMRWWPQIVLQAQRCATGSGFLMQHKGTEFRQIYDPH